MQVGKFLQLIVTFVSGFVVAFIMGWKLTLVMVSSIPPLAISGALMAVYISKMASRGQASYSLAATMVEQTIGSIRTVMQNWPTWIFFFFILGTTYESIYDSLSYSL